MTMTPAQAKKKAEAEVKSFRARQVKNNCEGVNDLFWDTSMTLESLEYHVEDWIRRFGKDSKIIFDVDYDYSDSRPNFYIRQDYTESDADYEARMKQLDAHVEKRAAEILAKDKKQNEADLKEFERLKKKLEKKGLV